MIHPPVVVAFTVLRRDGMTPEDSEIGILSFAGLRVVRRREGEARFELVHRAYPREDQAIGSFAEMRALLSPGCLVVGEAALQPAPSPGDEADVYRRCQDGMLQGLPMICADGPPHVSAMVLRGIETRMAGLAESYDIPLAADDASTVQQARALANRAQALWLTWLSTCCKDEETDHLATALDAWRRIEAARPLPF